MAETTLLRIVKMPRIKNNRLYVQRGDETIALRLIGGDEAIADLQKLVKDTGAPWRDYVSLSTHAEYGEFAFVSGHEVEGDTLFE
jgi:hypothetical protein|tara:strand:+ start:498 stop:752 length:255 start_codon:yes stop_codon:yes gene_type:complete